MLIRVVPAAYRVACYDAALTAPGLRCGSRSTLSTGPRVWHYARDTDTAVIRRKGEYAMTDAGQKDFSQLARSLVRHMTGEEGAEPVEESPHAAAGRKGGEARWAQP